MRCRRRCWRARAWVITVLGDVIGRHGTGRVNGTGGVSGCTLSPADRDGYGPSPARATPRAAVSAAAMIIRFRRARVSPGMTSGRVAAAQITEPGADAGPSWPGSRSGNGSAGPKPRPGSGSRSMPDSCAGCGGQSTMPLG